MPVFYIRQRRPMWVCFVEEIVAENEEEAETQIGKGAQYSFIENRVARVEDGPVSVFRADEFDDPEDVVNED